jgi:hypothetical protein
MYKLNNADKNKASLLKCARSRDNVLKFSINSFYTPVENGTYCGMIMSVQFSVRPSVRPSVPLLIMTVSVHFLSDG